MKNKLIDLNNHLFAQIERLGEENLSGDRLKEEVDRSKAITSISTQIVSNARLELDARIAIADSIAPTNMPKMIE